MKESADVLTSQEMFFNLGEEVWSPSAPHMKIYVEKQQNREDQGKCARHDLRQLL
jgi:hypothetical protein